MNLYFLKQITTDFYEFCSALTQRKISGIIIPTNFIKQYICSNTFYLLIQKIQSALGKFHFQEKPETGQNFQGKNS